MTPNADVLIIGAGIAGLSSARVFNDAGIDVTILEKSRGRRPEAHTHDRLSQRMSLVPDKGQGVGGRMATRRIQHHRFDHGAQYFTVNDPDFQNRVHEWTELGVVKPWFHHMTYSSGKADAHPAPRYISTTEGMTQIAKHIARRCNEHLTLHHTTEIVAIGKTDDQQWWAVNAEGRKWYGKTLLLTCPIPQSLALIESLPGELKGEMKEALQRLNDITYAPCIAMMALCDIPGTTPWPDTAPPGIKFDEPGPLAWIADNTHKYGSPQPGQRAFTLHGTPAYSRAEFTASDDAIVQAFTPELQRMYGIAPAHITEWQIHRWRYALVENPLPEAFLPLDAGSSLILAGDAFGNRAKLEGAWCSGFAAARALCSRSVPAPVSPNAL
jgi:renalase